MKAKLKLVRIQSVPVTLAILSAGYGLARGTLLEFHILPLFLVGALGHMGFYAMNEYKDKEYDRKAFKTDKPLVDTQNGLTTIGARVIYLSLIFTSLVFGIFVLPIQSFIYYLTGAGLGKIYNDRSKKDTFSAVYLGAWAVMMVLTGYTYAGGA